jgi:alkylation response protein AidB-like acyl-CoA dehydrogenase
VTALVRLTCAYVVETCTDAVKMMYLAGGGTALYESCPLERLFRDIHMITQHVAVAPYNIEMVGGYLLGQGLVLRR